jgi:hypothetical protein
MNSHLIVIRRNRLGLWRAACVCGSRSPWKADARCIGLWRRNHPRLAEMKSAA